MVRNFLTTQRFASTLEEAMSASLIPHIESLRFQYLGTDTVLLVLETSDGPERFTMPTRAIFEFSKRSTECINQNLAPALSDICAL
ncbi:hypothetical protein QA640_45650 (plasmid) [Bradyrhizobium sp. CB82]|uniref:hypothetical protein n=1 Tax=Bradyrhizobium sp. CB82 TaxID=3039159 RepID=UPI0024B1F810|nr:hypothetical protein [Bradyrhizobium sp. CB82]WFU46051.1 hypothetical protein QA640_45650 [Bradyrhizobium sp. CB82]